MKTSEAMRKAAKALRLARHAMSNSRCDPAWRVFRWFRVYERLEHEACRLDSLAWEYHELERKADFANGR